MEDCTHEEADTRVVLHVYIASQCGYWRVMIRTIDTDVVVLAVSKMQDIVVDELWIAFGTGKHFRYLAIHDIAAQLEQHKAKALKCCMPQQVATPFLSFLAKGNEQHGIPEVCSLK